MVGVKDKPILSVETVAEWEAFLQGHPDSDGARLKLRKTASAAPGITYADRSESVV